MKQVLLDTNILSYFLRGDIKVVDSIRAYRQHYSYLSFSIFTYYETKGGLLHRDARKQMQRFEQLANISEMVPFDQTVADTASEIYSDLRSKGLIVAPIDLLIGATAVCYDYVLVTANVKHFKNIPKLQYENWSV